MSNAASTTTTSPHELATWAFEMCWGVRNATGDVPEDTIRLRDDAVRALMVQTASWFDWDLGNELPISDEEQGDFVSAFLHYIRECEGDVHLAAIRAMRDLVEECAVRRFAVERFRWAEAS